MNDPKQLVTGHAAFYPTPMLPTPPDCGSPCAMCESYAHLLAKAREEIARLNQRILDDNKAYGCELRDPAGTIWDHAAQLQQEVARLQMELDSTCNAEELRQTRAENAALRDRAQRSELVANDRDFQFAERLRLERKNAALLATWSGWFEVVDGAERLAAFPKYSLAKDYADGTDWTIRAAIDAAKGGAK